MSYILDALKKADQERDIGAVPNLATPHEAKRPQTRSYRWLWIVVLLLSVNAVLAVMVLKDRYAKDTEITVAEQAPPESQAATGDIQPVQPVSEIVDTPVNEAPVPDIPAPPKIEPADSAGEVVVLGEPAYLQDSRASGRPEEDMFVQGDAPIFAEGNSQLQSWYDLPQDVRNRIDLPDLDVHVYSEDPLRRFIMVKLKKYREGQSLANGMVLEKILPDGMVMSYRGERFRVDK